MTQHIPTVAALQPDNQTPLPQLLRFLTQAQPQPDTLLESWGFRIVHRASVYTEKPDHTPNNFHTIKYIVNEVPEHDCRWDEQLDGQFPPHIVGSVSRVSFPTLFATLLAQLHTEGNACGAVGILANAVRQNYDVLQAVNLHNLQDELIMLYLHHHWRETAPLTRALHQFVNRLQRALDWENQGLRAYNDWGLSGRVSATTRLDEWEAVQRLAPVFGDFHFEVSTHAAYLDTVSPSFYDEFGTCTTGTGTLMHPAFADVVLSHYRIQKLKCLIE